MKTLTATEVARNFSRVLDELALGSGDVVVVRNHHPVARIIAGSPRVTALEALSDLYRTLDDVEGGAWLKDSAKHDRALKKEMRDPWA